MRSEIPQQDLRSAISIYYQQAYGKSLNDSILEQYVTSMAKDFADQGRAECILGFPRWLHARLIVKAKYGASPPYEMWVDPNDDPNHDPGRWKQKLGIEAALKEAGLPVTSD